MVRLEDKKGINLLLRRSTDDDDSEEEEEEKGSVWCQCVGGGGEG